MLMSNFQSFLVMLECAFEVLQLAMNPTNAIGHARIPEQIAVATCHSNRLFKGSEPFRHEAEVCLRQSLKEHRGKQQKPIAQLGSQTTAFNFALDRQIVLSLEKMQAPAPDQSGRQRRLVVDRPCGFYQVIKRRLGNAQFSITKVLERH